MKKRILTLVLTISMLLAMTTVVNADPKASWKAAKGTAKVDGKMDNVYKSAQKMKMAAVTSGDFDGTVANAWAAWDSKAIYFFIEVKDKILDDTATDWYQKDAIEFRLENKDQLLTCYAVTKECEGKLASASKIIKTKDGYNVEFKVPYDTSKGKVKFSLQVDAASNGKRNCTLHTNADLRDAWTNNDVFETLVFDSSKKATKKSTKKATKKK